MSTRYGSVFLLFALCAAASAQMHDCSAISGDGYKVVLDNVSVQGPGTQDANLLHSRLQSKVQFDLGDIKVEMVPQVVLVPCRDRTPQAMTDFNNTMLDSLNGHQVLVEIWGEVEAHTGVAVQRAQLNFTLVPISYYDRQAVPAGGFSTSYQRRLRGNPDDLVKLFGEFSDLKAYVSTAAGVKSLKEHVYDQAFLCFCRARSLLELPPAGMDSATRASLLDYIDGKVSETFTKAHSDASVSSALKLAGTQPKCPGAPR